MSEVKRTKVVVDRQPNLKVDELVEYYETKIIRALELLQVLHYKFPDYDDIHKEIEDIQKVLFIDLLELEKEI